MSTFIEVVQWVSDNRFLLGPLALGCLIFTLIVVVGQAFKGTIEEMD